MKTFGQNLKDIIDKNGFSVYRLSKMAEVERTGLQRCLSGQRLISEYALYRLLSCLSLDAQERINLLKSYIREQFGAEKYRQREIIQNLVSSLSRFCVSEPAPIELEKKVSIFGEFNTGVPIRGRYTVLHMVQNLMEYEICKCETPAIDMFLPIDKEFLDRIMPAPGRSKRKPVFRQLLQLSLGESELDNQRQNLEILETILPFHLSTGMDYKVYYWYRGGVYREGHMRFVLPYYIILNHSTLILLTEDLQNACICEAADFVGLYEEYFNNYIEESQVLVQHYKNLEQMLGHYKKLKIGTEQLYIMEYEPCFFSLMDYPMVEHYLPQKIENRSLLLNMILNHLKEMKSVTSTYCLVSHKGIEYFIKTGCMTDVPPGIDVRLSLSDRRLLLVRLREQCLSEESMLRIINPDYLRFPDFVTIRAGFTCGVDFSINNQKNIFHFLYITENTLSKAWADFIKNSLESPLVYGKEKTIQIIDDYIEKMIL